MKKKNIFILLFTIICLFLCVDRVYAGQCIYELPNDKRFWTNKINTTFKVWYEDGKINGPDCTDDLERNDFMDYFSSNDGCSVLDEHELSDLFFISNGKMYCPKSIYVINAGKFLIGNNVYYGFASSPDTDIVGVLGDHFMDYYPWVKIDFYPKADGKDVVVYTPGFDEKTGKLSRCDVYKKEGFYQGDTFEEISEYYGIELVLDNPLSVQSYAYLDGAKLLQYVTGYKFTGEPGFDGYTKEQVLNEKVLLGLQQQVAEILERHNSKNYCEVPEDYEERVINEAEKIQERINTEIDNLPELSKEGQQQQEENNDAIDSAMAIALSTLEEMKIAIDEESIPNTCEGLLDQELIDVLKTILNLIRIAAPILLIILTAVDFAQAVISNDQDAVKKATSKVAKRIIAALALFFIPYIVGIILEMPGISDWVTINNPNCNL